MNTVPVILRAQEKTSVIIHFVYFSVVLGVKSNSQNEV